MSEALNDYIEICDALKEDTKAQNVEYCKDITGGIINRAGLVKIDDKNVFVKYASRENAHGMFTSEYESLKLIENTEIIRVPHPGKVYALPQGAACFTLEFLEDLKPVETQWAALGEQIARLHRYNKDLLNQSAAESSSVHNTDSATAVGQFGFHHTIFVGPQFQVEPCWEKDWVEFFSRKLLKPQLDGIEFKESDSKLRELWSELQLMLDKPFRNITVQPAIVHGDFCTINVGEWQNKPVLFDPGCMYGHAEMDFTIPSMEKNLPEEFYQAYYKVLPKDEPGFAAREALYKFYGYSVVYNIAGMNVRQEALDTGRSVLSLIKNL